jgi:hypothetical protein
MKFFAFTILSALIAPLVYGAALNPVQVKQLAARETAVSNYEDVVGYALPDGRRKIDFYLNGALEGSAVETSDGGKNIPFPFPLTNHLSLNTCLALYIPPLLFFTSLLRKPGN